MAKKKVKLDEVLLNNIRESVSTKDQIKNEIFELYNSERIIKQQIENLWVKFYQVAEDASHMFEELQEKYGVGSELDLAKGTIVPSGNLPK
jgi:hypothetical protein